MQATAQLEATTSVQCVCPSLPETTDHYCHSVCNCHDGINKNHRGEIFHQLMKHDFCKQLHVERLTNHRTTGSVLGSFSLSTNLYQIYQRMSPRFGAAA